jgi:hypothetical protein
MDIVFAFLVVDLLPIIRQFGRVYRKLKNNVKLAFVVSLVSASAKPNVFLVQAVFCAATFALTGSVAFAGMYFMPSLLVNGVLL